jgi:hypothetical protein
MKLKVIAASMLLTAKVIAAEFLLTAMDFAAATIKRLKEALHQLINTLHMQKPE